MLSDAGLYQDKPKSWVLVACRSDRVGEWREHSVEKVRDLFAIQHGATAEKGATGRERTLTIGVDTGEERQKAAVGATGATPEMTSPGR